MSGHAKKVEPLIVNISSLQACRTQLLTKEAVFQVPAAEQAIVGSPEKYTAGHVPIAVVLGEATGKEI